MSSIVFQAADLRVLMPNSYFMVHYGETGYEGVAHGMKAHSDMNDMCNDTMLDIYASSCARSRDVDESTIRKQLVREMQKRVEWFLTPQEAVTIGLADDVYGG